MQNNELTKVYHKDYGLGDDFRIHAVADSLLYGVKTAAKKSNVSIVSIYKWRRDYAKKMLGNWSIKE